jgi:hypothetical protein
MFFLGLGSVRLSYVVLGYVMFRYFSCGYFSKLILCYINLGWVRLVSFGLV